MLKTREPDLDDAVAVCELRRETLYRQLLSFEDEHREVHPGCVPKKRRVLELAVAHNPLAAAIVGRKKLESDHPLFAGCPFIGQPITCFGLHEILRRTRFHRDFADGCSPGVLTLGGERVTHDQLLDWYRELVPNLNLRRVYDRSLLLGNPVVVSVLAGLVVGGMCGVEAEPGQWSKVVGAGILGAVLCALVLSFLNRAKYGRQLHKTAPWNSSLYVDYNLALLRDRPAALHLGCRAHIPRPQVAGWKAKSRYYPFAQHVADGSYLTALPTSLA